MAVVAEVHVQDLAPVASVLQAAQRLMSAVRKETVLNLSDAEAKALVELQSAMRELARVPGRDIGQ